MYRTQLSVILAILCTVGFPQHSIAQKAAQKGNVITYRGNKFELGPGGYDTIILVDPVTGKEIVHTTKKQPRPAKMNGEKIYQSIDFGNATTQATYQKPGWNDINLREYLLSNLTAEFEALPDLKYKLSVPNIVIDGHGRIAYYEYARIVSPNSRGAKEFHLAKEARDKIEKKMRQLLNSAPALSPAKIDTLGPVPYMLDGGAFMNPFTIKDHKVVAE